MNFCQGSKRLKNTNKYKIFKTSVVEKKNREIFTKGYFCT